MGIKTTSVLERAIDAHVGNAIRERRRILGQSQSQLGVAVGRSFQQMQKYERGMNRTPVGLLYRVAQAQGVTVSFYLEGFEPPEDE